MLDTGLSRTGLDRDWARTVGIEPVPASSTAVVDTIRLGELTLRNHPVALYPLHGLSEASGRLQVGLVGHDVLQHYTVDIDYQQRRVRLFDPARYRYKGTGATVRFTADADLPLLRAQVKVRGRHAIPARLLLDTGASGLCLILTTPFAEEHGLGRVAPAIEAPIGTGLAGELHGTIVRLQELRRGGGDCPRRRAPAHRRTRRRRGGLERCSQSAARGRSGAPARAATRRGYDPGGAEIEKAAIGQVGEG